MHKNSKAVDSRLQKRGILSNILLQIRNYTSQTKTVSFERNYHKIFDRRFHRNKILNPSLVSSEIRELVVAVVPRKQNLVATSTRALEMEDQASATFLNEHSFLRRMMSFHIIFILLLQNFTAENLLSTRNLQTKQPEYDRS